MNIKNSLIVGSGEIGKALLAVLAKQYQVVAIDRNETLDEKYDIIHICFPYSKDFIKEVKKYQKKFKPRYTVIHATVPPGTSKKCNAIHSPVVGLHPFLEEGIRTFTKFLGGERAHEVADYFRKAGIKVYLVDEAKTTEAMKIFSTSLYGLLNEYNKDVKRWCLKIPGNCKV